MNEGSGGKGEGVGKKEERGAGGERWGKEYVGGRVGGVERNEKEGGLE